MTRQRSSRGFIAVFSLGMLYLTFSIDWRGHKAAPVPRLTTSARAEGSWSAGAARIPLEPTLPATVAGYPPKRPVVREANPLFARAVALRAGDKGGVALVTAEILEVPEGVARRVREKGRALGLSDVIVAATHAHTSFGGYDRRLVVQIAATGSFEEAREAKLVQKLEQALEGAVRSLAPVELKLAQTKVAGVSANRDRQGGEVDDQLTALAATDAQGKPVFTVAIFGSHATMVRRDTPKLDGDWPSRAATKLEEAGGVGMVLQGAMGDTTSRLAESGEGEPVDRMGNRVAQAASASLGTAAVVAPSLAFASVELGLPQAEADHAVPSYLRMPAANVLHALAPRKAEVAILRLGGLALIVVPAEPTTAAGKALRERMAPFLPGTQLAIVSLANGYVGYVESAEAMKAGTGEAKRTLFGAGLLERLATALTAAVVEITAKR